jgi:hypothetical protein
VWQALYTELGPRGFVPITVALDQAVEAARPWIEAAQPTHPSLVDPEHVVADLYGVINVPTVIWIDEAGRIVRPCDVQFGTDTFKMFSGKESGPFLAALRRWVDTGAGALAADEVRRHQKLPTREDQAARAEFTLAWHLQRAGRAEAAERHFVRAGALSPHDWTIRRGSMPIRGIDPMGPVFFDLAREWDAAGRPSYPAVPLDDE